VLNPWTTLASLAALGALYPVLPVTADLYARFRAPRQVTCPDTGEAAEIVPDARHAALTGAFTRPRVRVRACTLWPARAGCHQACLRQIPLQEARPVDTAV